MRFAGGQIVEVVGPDGNAYSRVVLNGYIAADDGRMVHAQVVIRVSDVSILPDFPRDHSYDMAIEKTPLPFMNSAAQGAQAAVAPPGVSTVTGTPVPTAAPNTNQSGAGGGAPGMPSVNQSAPVNPEDKP